MRHVERQTTLAVERTSGWRTSMSAASWYFGTFLMTLIAT